MLEFLALIFNSNATTARQSSMVLEFPSSMFNRPGISHPSAGTNGAGRRPYDVVT
jgi:hypothetical protein